MGLKINLGCGKNVLDGWENLDPRTGLDARIREWKWNDKLPFPDGSAELVLAEHNISHCKPEDFDANFSEIMRVLEPGGKFVLKDADDRYYVWRGIGSSVDGGIIWSTLSEPKTEEVMARNGFVDISHDRQALVSKYESVITRVARTRRGHNLFIVEGTKPKAV